MDLKQRLLPDEYGYMWWANGLRDVSPSRRLHIQTGKYCISIDPVRACLDKLGIPSGGRVDLDALRQGNTGFDSATSVETSCYIVFDGKKYTNGIAPDGLQHTPSPIPGNDDKDFMHYQYRMIESGRISQNFDVMELLFDGCQCLKGHFEIQALPDYFSILYDAMPLCAMRDVTLGLTLRVKDPVKKIVRQAAQKASVFMENGWVFHIVLPDCPDGNLTMTIEKDHLIIECSGLSFAPHLGEEDRTENKPYFYRKGFAMIVIPEPGAGEEPYQKWDDRSRLTVSAVNTTTKGHRRDCRCGYDAARGFVRIVKEMLPFSPLDENQNEMDSVVFTIQNPTESELRVPVLFETPNEGGDIRGSVGFVSMLCEQTGDCNPVPTGNFVQISKNWHANLLENPRLLYDGQWMRCTTMLTIPAGETVTYTLVTAYQNWGGVPTASHAQLSLVGWGGNQLWEQAALGCIFENICYEPDGTQRFDGTMIDDVRPLFIRPEWRATRNVGGGNFLVYFKNGQRQYQTCVKSDYRRHGPNFTEVAYHYVTQDGAIEAEVVVTLSRTDDIVKCYHHVHYDVRRDTTFSRLAFYQMGSDAYNDHPVYKLAYGNEEGVIRADIDGVPALSRMPDRYLHSVKGLEWPGKTRWASLYKERLPDDEPAPFANRTMAIRRWEAKLSGKAVANPCLSSYVCSYFWDRETVNWEIAPPPDITELKAGDYVDCVVEYMVLPQNRDDYYGPQQDLMDTVFGFKENHVYKGISADDYKAGWYYAVQNDYTVKAEEGTLLSLHPIIVEAARDVACVEVSGGIGYLPLMFSGLDGYSGYVLETYAEDGWQPVDQSVHGGDFWQCDYCPDKGTYTLTFNVYRAPDCGTARYRLRKKS